MPLHAPLIEQAKYLSICTQVYPVLDKALKRCQNLTIRFNVYDKISLNKGRENFLYQQTKDRFKLFISSALLS